MTDLRGHEWTEQNKTEESADRVIRIKNVAD